MLLRCWRLVARSVEPAADELAVAPAGGLVELVAAAVLGGEEGCRAFEQVADARDVGPVQGE